MHNTTTALRQKVTLQLHQIVRLPRITFLYSTILWNYYMSCRQNSMAAKWNMILSFGLRAPFGFPCFAHVCLASWLGLWRVFLNGLRDFGCRAPFWRPCAFACVPVRLYSIGFCPSVVARSHFEVGGLACFYEWMDGVSDFRTYAWLHFLPGQSTRCKFQKGCKQSCKNGSVLMRQPPAKVEKSWNCLRFLFRFAFGLGKLNKTKNPSISFM